MTPWKFFSNFATNKITANVDCVYMMINNTRMWRRLRALWSHNIFDLTYHSAFLNAAFLQQTYLQASCFHIFMIGLRARKKGGKTED